MAHPLDVDLAETLDVFVTMDLGVVHEVVQLGQAEAAAEHDLAALLLHPAAQFVVVGAAAGQQGGGEKRQADAVGGARHFAAPGARAGGLRWAAISLASR